MGRTVSVTSPRGRFLASETGLPMPLLGDWDGDGRDDLLVLEGADLTVRLCGGKGAFQASPDLRTKLPFLETEGRARESETGTQALDVADVDRDGRPDLLAVVRSGRMGLFESFQTRVLYFPGAKAPGRPAQILSFEGAVRHPRLFDFDGDGRLDLLLPVLRVDLLSNIKKALTRSVRTTYRLHLFSARRGRFEKEPEVTQDLDAPLGDLEAGAVPPLAFLHGDHDGDGLKDLLLCREGREMEVRRGVREGGFLRSERFRFAGEAWWRGEVEHLTNVWLQDLDLDGRTDIFTWSTGAASVVSFPERP